MKRSILVLGVLIIGGLQVRTGTSWIGQLLKHRRQQVFNQTLRMLRLHAIPFSSLLAKLFEILRQYDARFTFPVVGSIALENPELVRGISKSGHEVAVHGFQHVRYRYLSRMQQEEDIKKSVDAFRKLAIPTYGFRAPYNGYTEHSPELIEKYGFVWDAGIGYDRKYRRWTRPFRITIDDHQSNFTCIPLNRWSDDLMIDSYGFNSQQIGEILKRVVKWTSERQGIVMFDLHPIRIAQPKYIDSIKRVLEYGTELNGWFPSVSEAVEQWNKKKIWKHNAGFCCLFTGDIDTVAFTDYLKRFYQ